MLKFLLFFVQNLHTRGHKPFMQLFDIVNIFSHTTVTSGHIVNQDQDVYNGLMQLTGEYQAVSAPWKRAARRKCNTAIPTFPTATVAGSRRWSIPTAEKTGQRRSKAPVTFAISNFHIMSYNCRSSRQLIESGESARLRPGQIHVCYHIFAIQLRKTGQNRS